MKVYYGGALQGARNREERAKVHKTLISCIKDQSYDVVTEHVTGKNKRETAILLEEAIGTLPPSGIERTIYIRNKMIEYIEGDISAAVFEVSVPSLGTGIEIAHTYLRPRIGLLQIPILALYEKDYWLNGLSTMIKGIPQEEFPNFHLAEYVRLEDAKAYILNFLESLRG